MAISGYLQLSLVIPGYLWLVVTIFGYLWLLSINLQGGSRGRGEQAIAIWNISFIVAIVFEDITILTNQCQIGLKLTPLNQLIEFSLTSLYIIKVFL